jgi:hypothetical protein
MPVPGATGSHTVFPLRYSWCQHPENNWQITVHHGLSLFPKICNLKDDNKIVGFAVFGDCIRFKNYGKEKKSDLVGHSYVDKHWVPKIFLNLTFNCLQVFLCFFF